MVTTSSIFSHFHTILLHASTVFCFLFFVFVFFLFWLLICLLLLVFPIISLVWLEIDETLFHIHYVSSKDIGCIFFIESAYSFPTSPSPLKELEMWLHFIHILFVCFFFIFL